MIQEAVLRLLPAEAGNEALIKGFLAQSLAISAARIRGWHIRRRSIDARKHPVHIQLHVQAWIDEDKPERLTPFFEYPDVSHQPKSWWWVPVPVVILRPSDSSSWALSPSCWNGAGTSVHVNGMWHY